MRYQLPRVAHSPDRCHPHESLSECPTWSLLDSVQSVGLGRGVSARCRLVRNWEVSLRWEDFRPRLYALAVIATFVLIAFLFRS